VSVIVELVEYCCIAGACYLHSMYFTA